jgi:hypothetical protein
LALITQIEREPETSKPLSLPAETRSPVDVVTELLNPKYIDLLLKF